MDLVTKLLVFAGLFLVALPFAYRRVREAHDPEWESRWRELSRGERKRIADAAQRGETFDDPEEAYLAAGSARSQRSIATGHSGVLRLVVAGVVLLAAVAQGSWPMAGGVLLLIAFLVWLARRERIAKRNLERVAEDPRIGP